jgi:hypothetical protein
MTQQTTSMVLHDCHKNAEEDNVCVGVYGVHIEKPNNKTGGVGPDKMDGEDQIGLWQDMMLRVMNMTACLW